MGGPILKYGGLIKAGMPPPGPLPYPGPSGIRTDSPSRFEQSHCSFKLDSLAQESASTNFVLALEAGEMMSLEDEISHLQKENSRIESQLSKIKGDVTSSEGEAVADDKV